MPRRKKKKSKTQRFIETAKRQFKVACIPSATAVCLSVGITKLGVPAIPLLVLGAGGFAYWKGYRLRIVKDGDESQAEPTTVKKPQESSAEGSID